MGPALAGLLSRAAALARHLARREGRRCTALGLNRLRPRPWGDGSRPGRAPRPVRRSPQGGGADDRRGEGRHLLEQTAELLSERPLGSGAACCACGRQAATVSIALELAVAAPLPA